MIFGLEPHVFFAFLSWPVTYIVIALIMYVVMAKNDKKEEAWEKAKLLSEREHVTLYLRNRENDFKSETIHCRENLEVMRWTVDEAQDFMFITQVFAELYSSNNDFNMDDILLLLKEKSELMNINQGIQRNEGLAKSIANDKMI